MTTTNNELEIGYWPKTRRQVAKVILTKQGLTTYPGTPLMQVTLNAVIAAAKDVQAGETIEPNTPLDQIPIHLEDLVPYLSKTLRKYKHVPEDAELDEILVIKNKRVQKEISVKDHLYTTAGPYYFMMTYLKNLAVAGYIERLTEAGSVVPHKVMTREKKSLKEAAADAYLKGKENV